MSNYLPFCNLLCSHGRIILLCFDWSIYSIIPGVFLPISSLVNLESPACRIGLHQTILSLPSDGAIPILAEVSPFQKSHGSTWTRTLCQGKDLVRMSAGLSIDGMCSKWTKPLATALQTL